MTKNLLLYFLLTTAITNAFGQEICNNGIDDDLNGLVDLNDTACVCNGFGTAVTVSNFLPNPSFEDHTCCPDAYSQIYCTNDWIQASNPTSDYWNTCGVAGSSYDGLATLPIPDGDGFVGIINMAGWQEYVGTCLNQPLVADTTYVFSFYMGYTNNSPVLDFTFYGTPNCGDLPFSGNDCPLGQGEWVQLGQTSVGGPTGWESITVSFTPSIDINAIVMGGSCGSGGARTYYYLDNLNISVLHPSHPIDIVATGLYCNHDAVLESSIDTSGGAWQWYFEGVALVGETADSLNISANGYDLGTYSSTYTLGGGCQVAEHTLTPPDTVFADFLTDSVCLGEISHFIDLSTTTADSLGSWDWDFGDGGTSDLQNPEYVYPSYGTFEVVFIPTTPTGCIDTAIAYAVVYPLPEADFDWAGECGSFEIEFTDQSTISGLSTNSEWLWSFGDGDSSNLTDPVHQFDSLGTYQVWLQVTSDQGCTDQTMQLVYLQLEPIANFTFTEVCLGGTTNFHDLSIPLGGQFVSWLWDLGDGNTSTQQNPIYTYQDTGTYVVSLTVTGLNGCSDSSVQPVEVFLCASVDENELAEHISIYPNPATDHLFVNSDLPILGVQLFNAVGQLAMAPVTRQVDPMILPIGQLSSGIYLLRVVLDSGETYEQKILVK